MRKYRKHHYRYTLLAACIVFAVLQPLVEAARTVPAELVSPLPANLIRVHETEHYLVAFSSNAERAEEIGRLLEGFRSEFVNRFSAQEFALRPHSRPLAWVCFDSAADYQAYGRRADRADVSWTKAYYSTRTNRVALLFQGVANRQGERMRLVSSSDPATSGYGEALAPLGGAGDLSPARIRHEAAHQLAYDLGLMTPGVMYPLWVAEGMATGFEVEAPASGPASPDNPARRRDLLECLERGRVLPLSELVVLAEILTGDSEQTAFAYAQAWGLWRFLMETRAPQVRQYLSTLAGLKMGHRRPQTLRAEFVRSFGPLDRLERAWREHLRLLVSASATVAPSQP